jgi:hypothetical protein
MMRKLIIAILLAFSVGATASACRAGARIGPVHAGAGVNG